MYTGAMKNAGPKPVAPAPVLRPIPAATKRIAPPEPRSGAKPDTAAFSAIPAPPQDDPAAKVAAAKKAQQARAKDDHGPAAQGEDAHHGHHPGAVAGEGARSANHLSHGAKGIAGAAREAEAIQLAAKEAEAIQLAAKEAEAIKLAAQEVQAAQKASKAIRDVAKVAGAAEAAHHAPSKLGKGLGVVGVAGGGFQVVAGVSQIRHGETAEGVKNVVVGGGFVASGAAELTLAAKVASKVAAPLAGAASAIEGGYDVVQGIRKGEGKKIALGGAKGAGGALLAASPFVTGSVVGAPVGAVMAIGGTTLIAGAAVVENWDTLKGWAKSGVKAVGNGVGWVGGEASDLAGAAWDKTKSVFSGW